MGQGQNAVWPALGRFAHRQTCRTRRRFSAAAWPRPPHPAQRTQSSRQYLGDEKARRAWIISVSAVGSLQEKYKPCDIVLIDQFLDRTKRNFEHTFFGRGIVAHVAFAHPICEELRKILLKTARACGATAHDGGTYVNMEGPAFSTRAESLTNHQLGYDRHRHDQPRRGQMRPRSGNRLRHARHVHRLRLLEGRRTRHARHDHRRTSIATPTWPKKSSSRAISQIPAEPNWPCHSALKHAILTDKKFWPKKTVTELKPILAKYL